MVPLSCSGDLVARSGAHLARAFGPDAVLDSNALTGADVDAVTSVLPDVPTVVLSSQDVYQAITALRSGLCEAAVPLDEQAELRRERYPYASRGYAGVPDDYDKLDVEERWLPRGAVVLRLPMVYGPHDDQQREAAILRRVLSGNREIPIGGGTLLWTRAHVDDVASAALAALDNRSADGLAVNIGEERVLPIGTWFRQIADAAGADVSFATVPDARVPVDLSISKNHSQHLLASVARAHELLHWRASDADARVRESVAWHLQNSRFDPWTDDEQARDVAALREH
ncbi:NAD-dependent epimerase/dehydratase family protein [Curtobacterium sp. L1-20]|uniref:NAD-dependent epimerase/dehydratase family protein n=1 Tax=Curtobacterium sp. L1-20 TaxID=3138181 RepID=UPI003B52A031